MGKQCPCPSAGREEEHAGGLGAGLARRPHRWRRPSSLFCVPCGQMASATASPPSECLTICALAWLPTPPPRPALDLPPPRAAPFSSEGLTPWGCCLQPSLAPCCLWDQVREPNAAGLGGSALPAPEPPPLAAQALETSVGVSFPLDMPARGLQPALQESPQGRETQFSAPLSLPAGTPPCSTLSNALGPFLPSLHKHSEGPDMGRNCCRSGKAAGHAAGIPGHRGGRWETARDRCKGPVVRQGAAAGGGGGSTWQSGALWAESEEVGATGNCARAASAKAPRQERSGPGGSMAVRRGGLRRSWESMGQAEHTVR